MSVYGGQRVFNGAIATGAEVRVRVGVDNPGQFVVVQAGTAVASAVTYWTTHVTPLGSSFAVPTEIQFLGNSIAPGEHTIANSTTRAPGVFDLYIRNDDLISQSIQAFVIPSADGNR